MHVLSAVMIFLGQNDTSWQAMKNFLSTSGVIGQIIGFDARNVTPQLRNKVNKVIGTNPASFEQAVISRASNAAAPLAAWCVSQIKYSSVLNKIEPLTSELDSLLAHLQHSQERVQECEEQLAVLQAETDKLNADF